MNDFIPTPRKSLVLRDVLFYIESKGEVGSDELADESKIPLALDYVKTLRQAEYVKLRLERDAIYYSLTKKGKKFLEEIRKWSSGE